MNYHINFNISQGSKARGISLAPSLQFTKFSPDCQEFFTISNCPMIFAFIMGIIFLLISKPIPFLLVFSRTFNVVPPPTKGSSTTSPSRDYFSTAHLTISSGQLVRYLFLSRNFFLKKLLQIFLNILSKKEICDR